MLCIILELGQGALKVCLLITELSLTEWHLSVNVIGSLVGVVLEMYRDLQGDAQELEFP